MFGLLLTLILIDGAFLAVIILLQSGKGGGLASMGGGMGTDTLIGGRQAATILTKATWVAGGVFLVLALALSIVSSRQRTPTSVLQSEFQRSQQQAAPAPIQVPGTEQAEPAPAGAPTAPATTN